ncbi:MAG: prolipoprotein diacylglyceryl transferase [Alphaproteobacteria bacterium]
MFEFPNIDPVALSLGPLQIRWYALSYLAGFVLGWRYCLSLVRGQGARPNADDIDDFLTWAIVGVILGGRIGYVLFYSFDYFLHDPLSALKIWQGGMSFHGGTLGVLVAMFGFAWRRKIDVLRLADVVCAAAPIGLFFGRLANFINGELFGRVTESAVGIVFPRGGELPRHPSQLYEAALEGLVLFVVLAVLIRNDWVRARSGIVAGAFLVGYGVFRAFVELFREPDAHIGLYFDVISQGQILCVPMILGGVAVIVWRGFFTVDARR